MALSLTKDFTAQFNDDYNLQIDLSGWDWCTVHIVGAAGEIDFKASNDAGGVIGVSDGNAASATNFVDVQGINLATGAGATSLASGSAMFRFPIIGQFLQLSSSTKAVDKLLIQYSKIY